MIKKTIDLKNKINCISVNQLSENGSNYTKATNQDFYYSPTKKMIHLAEKLPNGDWWVVKSFKTSNVIVLNYN